MLPCYTGPENAASKYSRFGDVMVKKFTGELCPIGGKTTEKKEAVKSHVLSPDWSSVLTNENKGFLQGWIQIDPKKTAKKFDKIIGII